MPYLEEKENKDHKGEIVALSGPIPNWVESINEEIQTNPTLQGWVQLVNDGEAVGPWRIQNGLLIFKEKIYLAEDSSLIGDIIGQFHNSTHEGFLKSLNQIQSTFYWKGMRKQIK